MCDFSQSSELDCAVCLQKCNHPTRLPCRHIFCFLCMKGAAIQSGKCPMCRAVIPTDYLDNPVLLEKHITTHEAEENLNQYQWYYEGRNGWWKYDERSNSELEAAYSSESPATDFCLLVAGALYHIDFEAMVQIRKNDSSRRRRVRREIASFPSKGVAGIKMLVVNEQEKQNTEEASLEETDNQSEITYTDNETSNDLDIIQNNNNSETQSNALDGLVGTLQSLNLEDQHSNNGTVNQEQS